MQERQGNDWLEPKPATPENIKAATENPKTSEIRIAKENTAEYQQMLKRLRETRKRKRRALAKQRRRAR
jgi:hypothetical protein